ncbi:MAG: DNA polymerase/3'-5' exonuclease PolX [Myxococcota bacterium]
MRNEEIRALIRELGELTVLDEQSPQSFRARAYDKAVQALENVSTDLAAMSLAELQQIPGIGKATAEKIRSYVDTGKIAKLEALREKFPPDVVKLSRIPGLGPKTLAKLRATLDVQSVADLVAAIDAEKLRDIPGLGAKTEEKLKSGIERLGFKQGEQRTPIAPAMGEAMRWVELLREHPDVVEVVPCGSLRRQRETVGDIDIVVATEQPAAVTQFVASRPGLQRIIASGSTKTSVIGATGLQVDVRFVRPEQMGAALMYFTGSKAHNIKLRQIAMDKGWILNEYALAHADTEEVIASRTEGEIYAALGLPLIPPPMREDTGEVEAARAGTLPRALEAGELLGDLHVHTTYSGDGRSTLADVVAAAHARGYRYLAITDHAENLAMNGIGREELARQADELAALQEGVPTLRLMRGSELNIAADGSLDYDEDFRLSLDWCVAAVHTAYDLPQAQQTERLIRAIRDPAVRVIGHLTGRMIGRRPGIDIDVDAVLDALVEYDVLLEINSALPRLDAAAPVLRRAREKKVLFAVSTDAHHVKELDRTQWGARQAQRGWVDPDREVNTWSPERFADWMATQRARGKR